MDPYHQPRSGTSPWVWVAVGCLLAVVLGVGTVVAIGWFAMHQMKDFAESMEDPERRAAKVYAALGTEELPPGYHPVMAMSIPWVMQMALLSDEEPTEGGDHEGMGESGFLYVTSRTFGEAAEIRAYLEGEASESEVLDNVDLAVDPEVLLARGSFEEEGASYTWASHRGRRDGTGPDGRASAIQGLVLVGCGPRDATIRLGAWWIPDPAPETPPEELELAGTPADAEAIRELFSYFDLC